MSDVAVGRITIINDSFGRPSALRQDWGFAALIEFDGLRILFDTGNNARVFAHNIEVLGIDLRALDFAVISHRHGDHTSGLAHLLQANPTLAIYTPEETYCRWPWPRRRAWWSSPAARTRASRTSCARPTPSSRGWPDCSAACTWC